MDSDDEDDEETVENDSDSNTSDLWENLRAEVRDALNSSYVEEVERFLEEGEPREVAKAKALNFLLPAHRRKLRRLYLHYLKCFRRLRGDPVHQKITATLRCFMDQNSLDYEEAPEAAVDKQKFLLNRVFERLQVPDEEEEEDTSQEDDLT